MPAARNVAFIHHVEGLYGAAYFGNGLADDVPPHWTARINSESGTSSRVWRLARSRSAWHFSIPFSTVALMPPSSSYQRRDLDRARAAGKDDVKKMVDSMPGLFE